MARSLIRFLVPPVLIALFSIPTGHCCLAQIHIPDPASRPDLYVNIQDSSWTFRVAGRDTTPAERFSAAYVYEILYDSIGMTKYMFSECRKNGVRLRLPQWKYRRHVNVEEKFLSYNSRTDNFMMATGDTLSFYRELSWYDPRTFNQDVDTYYSRDSLDYAVELVRASDSIRVALLDSIGVLPSYHPGVPDIHGTRPIIALVAYRVPPELNGIVGFIRVRLYARGSGEYFFTRSDRITIRITDRLTLPFWVDYLNRYSLELPKYMPGKLSSFDHAGSLAKLDVRAIAGSSRDVSITFASLGDLERLTVAIYNAAGEAIFYPYTGVLPSGETTVSYHFPAGGIYFVALLRNSEILATRNIIIN